MTNSSMNERIRSKLGSRAGESISETLVALLISALALVMLAGVITTSTRIVTSSRESMNNYYDACNAMVDPDSSTDEDTEIETGTGKVTIKGTGVTAGISGDVEYTKTVAGGSTIYYYRSTETD